MDFIYELDNYYAVRKSQYVIHVCYCGEPTPVYNFLEHTDYITDDDRPFILHRTVGEEWIIDYDNLVKKYTFGDGSPISFSTLSKRIHNVGGWIVITPKIDSGAPMTWACHVPVGSTFPVKTAWGDTLIVNRDGIPHGQGDFVMCADKGGGPDFSDMWVINGEVFSTTYEY